MGSGSLEFSGTEIRMELQFHCCWRIESFQQMDTHRKIASDNAFCDLI